MEIVEIKQEESKYFGSLRIRVGNTFLYNNDNSHSADYVQIPHKIKSRLLRNDMIGAFHLSWPRNCLRRDVHCHAIELCLDIFSHAIELCFDIFSHAIVLCLRIFSHAIELCLHNFSHVIELCLDIFAML
ncbi:hypothetical protein PoB_004631100 [Plakobranchus ocellatus]|uniref:Uncharacterized protein n=1 Tax=Plakobranchus ocellatus TaxID=259542 RepID=A0AAV4BH85_9GAST|nr:hypothetical protein PoB_004631100 [Plakobranchus ocellatus]